MTAKANETNVNQKIFFHLHQAIRSLELNYESACPALETTALHSLREAEHLMDQKQNIRGIAGQNSFTELLSQTWDIYRKRDSLQVSRLETLRYDLHRLAEEMNLNHDANWYQDVNKCPKVSALKIKSKRKSF